MDPTYKQPPSESERIRWSLLGLGPEDEIRDIPDDRIEEEKRRLEAAAAKFVNRKSRHSPTPCKMRLARTLKIAAMICCIGLVSYGAFFSIKNVAANQQRRAGNRYAISLMQFSLDLFEEDMDLLSHQVARSEQLLPDPQFLHFDSQTYQRIHACPEALQALMSVRMGFPQRGFSQLEPVTRLMSEDGSWGPGDSLHGNQKELEFIFNLTAGKTIFESMQTSVGRSFIDRTNIKLYLDLAKQSVDMLEHALEMLDQQQVTAFKHGDESILKAAIQIDLARARIKFGNGDFDFPINLQMEWLEQTQRDLAVAESNLALLNRFNPRCIVQKARCLNNQILNAERIMLHGQELDEADWLNRLDEFNVKISELASNVGAMEISPRAAAINFEVAICYTNLADLLRSLWELGRVDLEDQNLELRLELRQKAAELLNEVPRLSRTERHFENLVSNRARHTQTIFVAGLIADPEFKPTQELHNMAMQLYQTTGDLFDDKNVGQIPVESRLAAAMILDDIYSVEAMRRFAERIPSPAGSLNFRSRAILLQRLDSLSADEEKPSL